MTHIARVHFSCVCPWCPLLLLCQLSVRYNFPRLEAAAQRLVALPHAELAVLSTVAVQLAGAAGPQPGALATAATQPLCISDIAYVMGCQVPGDVDGRVCARIVVQGDLGVQGNEIHQVQVGVALGVWPQPACDKRDVSLHLPMNSRLITLLTRAKLT